MLSLVRIFIFILVIAQVGRTQVLSGKDIVEKSELNIRSGTSYAEMEMTIIRPRWTRTIDLKCWTEGLEKTLIQITAPARDKGIGYLKLDDEIWNWQPKIERTIKLPPSMMSQSWMGSDFTNDDLVKQSSLLNDYTHQLIGEENINGQLCYKIKLNPIENAAVVWGELMVWISQNDFLQLKIEFYDEELFLINTMIASDIKKFNNRTLPSKLTVTPENDPDHQTIIQYKVWEFDQALPKTLFSIQNMKKQI